MAWSNFFWTKLHFKGKKFGIYNFQRHFRIPFCEQLVCVYNNITESNDKNTFSAKPFFVGH